MPPFNIPSDIKQKKLLKACKKAGLRIDKHAGKGSHVKIYNSDGNFVIIQHKLYKQMIIRILNEIKSWNFDIQKIIKNL